MRRSIGGTATLAKSSDGLDDRPEIIDIHSVESDKTGIAGVLEAALRRHRQLFFSVGLAPLIALCLCLMGIALVPGVALFHGIRELTEDSALIVQYLGAGMSIAFGFFLYGLCIVFLAPLTNWLLRLKIRPWKGNWYSLDSIPWYYHNALTYLVRYTFLDLITPGPLNILFFRMMGMKIGKGVLINTSNISDPALIRIDDHATVGGSATILGHYGQKGILILGPVHIKSGAMVGIKATIMGDVVIGRGVVVPPHAVVLPKTRLADTEETEPWHQRVDVRSTADDI